MVAIEIVLDKIYSTSGNHELFYFEDFLKCVLVNEDNCLVELVFRSHL